MQTNYISFLRLYNFVIFLCVVFLFASCINTKKATYFSNVSDSVTLASTSQVPVSFINASDILGISITSLNMKASNFFNTNQASGQSSYIVDSTGYIQIPLLGNIKAEGLTINQLKTTVTKELIAKELLVEPIVTIHYLNYKVTILGEVRSPMVITVPNEKISILEAIGQAGDLTIYAKLNSVLVIRETEKGKKTFNRLNLNSNEIFRSPYYYLKSGDIVYVEPNRTRIANASRTSQYISYGLSGLSLILIIVQLSRL